MRILAQRVRNARVRVDGAVIGEIGPGLLCLVGFGREDGPDLPTLPRWSKMLDKLCGLRVFADKDGKINLSVADIGGSVLAVSQFTLYADCAKGLRPSFHLAAPPDVAQALYKRLLADLNARLPGRIAAGVFGAHMDVELTNHGPVTILLDDAGM